MTAVALALGDHPHERELVAALDRVGGLTLARRCVDLADLLATAATGAATVAVVSPSLQGLDRDAVARLAAASVPVVAVVTGDADEVRLAAVGALRCVRLDPADPDATAALVAAAVGEARLRAAGPSTARAYSGAPPAPGAPPDRDGGPRVPAAGARRGTIMAVWGPPGSPGRTTVAIALADEAARLGAEVLLVDADTHAASIAPMLALPDDLPGIGACTRAADVGRLDLGVLRRQARRLPGGLMVLTGLPRADRWPELRPASLETLLEVARELADVVVVDVGPSLGLDDEVSFDVLAPRRDGAALTVLDALAADDVLVVVGAAEPVGLLRLVGGLAQVREGWPELAPTVVLTRVRRSAVGGDPSAHVRPLLARHAAVADAVLVPDDRDAFDAATLAGRTLAEQAPSSPARLVLSRLAASLVPGQAAAAAASISSSRRRALRSFGRR